MRHGDPYVNLGRLPGHKHFRDFAAQIGAAAPLLAPLARLPQAERGAQPVGVHAAAVGFASGKAVQEFDQVAASGGVIGGLPRRAAVERGMGSSSHLVS